MSLSGVLQAVLAAAEDGAQAEPAPNAGELVPMIYETIRERLLWLWEGFWMEVPLLVAGAILLLLTWAAAGILDRVVRGTLQRRELPFSRRMLVRRIVRVAVWGLGLLLVIITVIPGVTPGSAVAGLGVGGVAIGFAFKDIFENFFAGLLILWRFPFEKGDFISCQEILGKVEDVTIRNTLVRRVTGELVVVPNATIFKNPVDVLTDRNVRQIRLIAGVAYEESVDEARETIREAVESCETVDADESIEIFAQELAGSSVNFEVAWWTEPTPLGGRQSRDEVIAAIKGALDGAKIEIPYPHTTLTFKEPLTIAERGGEGDVEEGG